MSRPARLGRPLSIVADYRVALDSLLGSLPK